MRRLVGTVVAVLAMLCTGVVFPVAHAQEQPPTVLILDASGSMLATDVGGGTRMDAAKTAISNYLDKATGTPPGLVVYGTNTGSSDDEKQAGCQDVTTLARPGQATTGDLKAKVAGINASGYTPIGKSLQEANSLLPGEGDRTIVLVSDGIDTCAPPPVCDVAKQLKATGTQLVVHTIGFQVDEQARAELQCIADATGGTYADAKDAGSLENTITTASTRTATSYTFPDRTIQGVWASPDAPVDASDLTAEQIAGFPLVEPGTKDNPARFHLTLPKVSGGTDAADTRDAYLRVPMAEGTRLQMGATAVPPTRTGTIHTDPNGNTKYEAILSMSIDQYNENGFGCYNGWQGFRMAELSFELPVSQRYTGSVIGGEDDCAVGNTLVRFSFGGSALSLQEPIDVDVTLAAVAEPTDLGDPINHTEPTERTNSQLVPPTAGNDTHVSASYTPDHAQLLNGTTTAEIVEGETQYFAIDLGWGQHLDANLEILKDDYIDKGLEGINRQLEVSALGSLGQPIDLVSRTHKDGFNFNNVHVEPGDGLDFGTTLPVTYANTTEFNSTRNGSWLAGRHVIGVSMMNATGSRTDATTQSTPVTYRLTLTPTGNTVQGPTFPDTPILKPTTTTSSTNTTTPDQQPTTTNNTTTGLPLWGWAAIGATTIITAAIIAAILTLRHTRKNHH
ncbi:hypothetical protein HMPREF1531_01249 [Propionibacterium sp. oral taxon 192 str. F0372]|uniref:vWA domain-containing protein n=1 Tax=Propionibacterium sp. oral taxon 192 TaxID=671222 RepID=UPI000353F697|nr:VWA domain-containing protein [Propionibacterium sp. oral taxon 192]EPH03823.1 hypothetical protein HMPREF1531_01249 [Propionibacterium sp. oral taxon 192 str. F0372]